jgi:hypothetical protein
VTAARTSLFRAPAPADLSMGVGPAGQHPDYPGLVAERYISENNQRLFYRRWGEFRHPARPDHGSLSDDVLYFMPRRNNVPCRQAHRELTPLGDLAILEEDKRNLEMRVARLDTGIAWAEDPPSRTRHLIGDPEAPLEKGEERSRPRFWCTAREDVRNINGAWKVRRCTIVPDINVLLYKPQRLPLRVKTGSGATWN